MEEEVKTEGVVSTTLGAYGAQLPVGIVDGGKFNKTFSVKKWRTKEEREMAEHRVGEMSMSAHVTVVVAYMLDQIGPHKFDEKTKFDEKVVRVKQMYAADVFYVYCYLRRHAINEKLQLTVPCGRCSKKFPWQANLDTLEVRVVEDAVAMRRPFKLETPINIRQRKVTHFQISPFLWDTMNTAAANGRSATGARISAILGSVIGLNDEPDAITLAVHEIDELTKHDFERLSTAVNEAFVGPKMAVEGTCSKEVCPLGGGFDFTAAIDWSTESFFDTSSR